MKYENLILFDGDCAFCNRAVHHILQIDRKKIYCFAPLKGRTAKEVLGKKLKEYEELNTLVLIEEYTKPKKHIWIRSKAFFRILWLIGGAWKLLGFFFFFPAIIGDLFYKIIARHRHKMGASSHSIKKDSDRFLY